MSSAERPNLTLDIMPFAQTLGVRTIDCGPESGTTTIESKTNFTRSVPSGFVEAVSKPLHRGRSVIVVETDLRDSDGRLVARVIQSQLVLRAG